MTRDYSLLVFELNQVFQEAVMRILVGILLFLACPSLLWAGEAVGTVKTLSGKAFLIRQGETLELMVGMTIKAEDKVKTATGSSLGLILQDDTTVSLGPESELLVRDFIFEPKQSRFSMVLKMLKGSFLYMSGVIGKLAPESIKLETPDSTIAVRGTRLLIKVTP
jgi:hypothetical protein